MSDDAVSAVSVCVTVTHHLFTSFYSADGDWCRWSVSWRTVVNMWHVMMTHEQHAPTLSTPYCFTESTLLTSGSTAELHSCFVSFNTCTSTLQFTGCRTCDKLTGAMNNKIANTHRLCSWVITTKNGYFNSVTTTHKLTDTIYYMKSMYECWLKRPLLLASW